VAVRYGRYLVGVVRKRREKGKGEENRHEFETADLQRTFRSVSEGQNRAAVEVWGLGLRDLASESVSRQQVGVLEKGTKRAPASKI